MQGACGARHSEGNGTRRYTAQRRVAFDSLSLAQHGFRATNIEKRFWYFGEQYFVPMRAALRLRLELLPHLYTAARQAFDTGVSPIRPLYHEWPTLDAAYQHPGEYLFGRSLAVTPVTKRSDGDAPLARGVQVWVPPGRWVLMHSGLAVDGPRVLERAYALDEVPMLAASGEWIFGATPPDAEWEGCSGGLRGWLGRAQRPVHCPQASLWLGALAEPEPAAATWRGSADMYEDDGWSYRYMRDDGATARTTLSWRAESQAAAGAAQRARIHLWVTVHAARGCLHSASRGALDEPGQPPSDAPPSGRRSWRLLLHGVPPPLVASVGGAARPSSAVGADTDHSDGRQLHFVDPAAAERLRRSRATSEPGVWLVDAERLCLVVWLFDTPSTETIELRLSFDQHAVALGARVMMPVLSAEADASTGSGPWPAVGVMRRAQAAKALLDATYPETQPQDYDRVTWLAGLGSRLAALPSNYTREVEALPALVRAARDQLRSEPAKRVSSAINKERVRNATALLLEI